MVGTPVMAVVVVLILVATTEGMQGAGLVVEGENNMSFVF